MAIAPSTAIEKLASVAMASSTADEAGKRILWLEYLALVGEHLLDHGCSPAVLGPLLDIHEDLQTQYSNITKRDGDERRRNMQVASPMVMGRITAVIDILIAAGFSADNAAQIVSRQMLARNLGLPEEGGDSRGWKRVQIWHHRITTLGKAHPQFETYQAFKNELLALHGQQTASLAVGQAMWDRRTR